jgi:hypothetical protein
VGIHKEPESARYSRSSVGTAAIMELRFGFTMHGLDVSAYADDQISGAIATEAIAGTDFSRDLFSRAFERLTKS